MDGSAGRWVDASMECWVDAGAWWMVAWQMGDVLATSQYRPRSSTLTIKLCSVNTV